MIDVLDILARGGGGGSGGGGGAGGIIAVPIVIVSAILTFIYRQKKMQAARKAHKMAVASDASWEDSAIYSRVEEVFFKFQKDWSDMNLHSMKTYLTPHYYNHMELVIRAMKQLKRKNVMTSVELREANLFGVRDNNIDELDEFDMEVKAAAHDKIVSDNHEILFMDKTPFQELWHFEKEKGNWCLEGITQSTSEGLVMGYHGTKNIKYVNFAKKHKFFYNADFGWLLLPLRGALFGTARFGTADINHHTIGEYKGRVVQLFEYYPIPASKITLLSMVVKLFSRKRRVKIYKYTVGQITLPKSYGKILVEPRDILSSVGLSFRPKGMQKISYAPVSFEKKFDVYATDEEQVTSFELLHPAYLEKLVNISFEVDIEVVDDNLYLYSSDKNANFDELLHLLKAAYDELER